MQITPRRKRKMTDSEFKEFLKKIAKVIEEGCWVTNYYKNRGQARLYYKNKYVFLYQLSHLLFNNDQANRTSIFHMCNNLICFNPTHLTNDLKKKEFKLLMSNNEIFEGCSPRKDKKKILIDYGNWLFKELGRSLVQKDFEISGRISLSPIIKYFGGVANYFNSCDFPSVKRKENMPNSEMKKFLKDKAKVTENGCWITNNWKTSRSDGRIQIQYKGKLQFLSRVSYTLFKGSIPSDLVATHSCDNPACYNPDHIFTDTHEGNMRQAARRGRMGGSIDKRRERHGITDPEDYEALLNFAKQHIKLTEKGEWIFPAPPSQVYPTIKINNKKYQLHRLLLANKLGKKYEKINVSCHRLPDGSKPHKHDVNPDHIFEGTRRKNGLDTVNYHKGYRLNADKANKVKDAVTKSDFSEKGSKTSFDKEWAAKLNVSKTCISDIRLDKTWNQSYIGASEEDK